jgi:hypothetical protein
MQTVTAETLMPACPGTVHAEVLALGSRLWGVGPADIITSTDGELLVHAVPLDGQPSCWLSWTFAVAGPSLTRVRLSHDEAAVDDSAPEPDLDAVLGMLLAALMPQQSAAGQTRTDHTRTDHTREETS